MGNSFRRQPLPVLYPDNKTPFANDLLEVGLFTAFAMIAFSFLIIIPGIRGWEVSVLNYPVNCDDINEGTFCKYALYKFDVTWLYFFVCSGCGRPFECSWRYG